MEDLKMDMPCLRGVALCRYDLQYLGRDQPHNRPLEAWGAAGIPHPTFAEGDTPRAGFTWAAALTALGTAGWVQEPTNASLWAGGNITCPYRIELNAVTKEWMVQENQMDVSNTTWLTRIADFYLNALANHPEIGGLLITPVKQQWAIPFSRPPIQHFAQWIFNTPIVNAGWDINTNTGGTVQAQWGVPVGATNWRGQTYFDDTSNTLFEVIEASYFMMRYLAPLMPAGQCLVYDPFQAHVGWANTSTWETQYLGIFGGTPTDARNYWRDRQFEMYTLSNGHYMFPTEAGTGVGNRDSVAELTASYGLSLADRDALRDCGIRYPPLDQTGCPAPL